MNISKTLVHVVFAGLLSGTLHAYDNNHEKLIAERLQERVRVGTPVFLSDGQNEFLAIHTEQMTDNPQGAVILLHGLGAHPDWPVVITQLRKTLPQRGWSTLSIQLPVLSPEEVVDEYGKTLDEARRRIDKALEYLSEQQVEVVVLIGYSFGGATGIQYMAKKGDNHTNIIGVAGISAVAKPFLRPPLKLLEEIEKVKVPILDVYGSRDFREIVDDAPDRRLAARKGENPWYEQIEIEGADHNYSGLGTVLSKRISGWMKKLLEDYRTRQDNESAPAESSPESDASQ